jgi:8-oxo-dGTP pyrophosphatase MutT (NUDIX family)
MERLARPDHQSTSRAFAGHCRNRRDAMCYRRRSSKAIARFLRAWPDLNLPGARATVTSAPVKFERSAGVLLFRDTAEGRVFLLLDYGNHWDYPKGHVEKGEDDRTAALRELAEETGITDAELLPDFAREITYIFKSRHGGLIKKTVVFFLARTEESTVTISHEHVGYEWLSPETARKRLSYATARSVLDHALTYLN